MDQTRRIVDEEALAVGDRNILDHALATIGKEVDVLSRTLSEILDDPTKTSE